MMSPGSRVTQPLMRLTMAGQSKIRSAVVCFCTTSPLRRVWSWRLRVVDAGDDGGAERGEGVAAFGAPPLQVLACAVLPVALADIVAAGDAEDGVAGFVGRDIARALADDDDEFAFVVHVGGFAREDDGLVGILQRGDGFVEDLGMRRLRASAEMAFIVQADGQDFAGLARDAAASRRRAGG